MTISKDLLLAILSLDSYSRGYGAAVDDGEGTDDGLGKSSVGNTTYKIDSTTKLGLDNTKAAGFYAVSYTVGEGVDGIADGTTVISYRGTDNFGEYYNADRGANDILNGWLGGSGTPTSQTSLALEFYRSVTGKSVFEGAAENTILTGHSLGGGLAGLVSALSTTPGLGYDYMPFGLLSYAHYYYEQISGGAVQNAPQFSQFDGIYVSGEALQAGRNGIAQGGITLSLSVLSGLLGFIPLVGPALTALTGLGAFETVTTPFLELR